MNIPEIYLIEPYNAYAPKGRKKHWHEVVEEQALMARILAEQQALQEAASKTLPPQAPEYSTPTIVGNSAGAGQAGHQGSAAGGGGVPVFDFFNQGGQVIGFTATPSTGPAGFPVQFTDTSTGPQEYDSFLWLFGDGTTSTSQNPTHTYITGSYTAVFQITSSNGFMASTTATITANLPVLSNTMSVASSSKTAPALVTLTDTVNYNGAGTITYLWLYGTGSVTSSLAVPPPLAYSSSGTYTAVMQVTESAYNVMSKATATFVLS
jgi:PKD repeat protein